MDEAKFWSKVDRSDPTGRWPWLGTITEKGYGVFGRRFGVAKSTIQSVVTGVNWRWLKAAGTSY